jgi:hypothetical protein
LIWSINFRGIVNEIKGQILNSSQGRGQARRQVVEVAVGHDQRQVTGMQQVQQSFQELVGVGKIEGGLAPARRVLKV